MSWRAMQIGTDGFLTIKLALTLELSVQPNFYVLTEDLKSIPTIAQHNMF